MDTRLPLAYAFVVVMPFISSSTDALAGLILKSQELPSYAAAYFLGGVLGMTGGWGMVVIWLAVRLCNLPNSMCKSSKSRLGGSSL